MTEQTIVANGVALCSETFGTAGDPPILLIMGATASMIRWEDEFCQRLADRGRYIIRYDSRDTGRSVSYPPGSPGYDLNDLVDDAAGVLAAHGLAVVHVVGLSLGGIVTQRLAIRYPDRVASITLMMTNPDGVEPEDVQVMTAEMIELMSTIDQVDWTDEDAGGAFLFEQWRLCQGNSTRPFDEQRCRQLAARDMERADDIATSYNHARIAVEARLGETLDQIRVPTLVIHGTLDPVLPFAYGKAFADAIPHSKLVAMEGAGHELHPDDWEEVIDAIVAHTAGPLTPGG